MDKKDFKETGKRIGGYFTVEASMVMPSVIVLTGIIFYLTFYLYDRCIVSQDTYILAFNGSLCCGKEAEEVRQKIKKESSVKLGKKYISSVYVNWIAEADRKSVTVETKGKMAAVGWKFGAKWEAQRICPTDCVRKMRLIMRIKSGLED